MKNRTTVALIAMGLFFSAALFLPSTESGPEAMISHARTVILTPDASRDAIIKALVEVLDASLLILPKTEYAEEYKSRIESVKRIYGESQLFSDKAHQYLGLAYKLVTGGKAWQVPDELKAPYREKDIMEQAKKVCLRLIDSALAARRAGRDEQSVRYLLEFVLMVITPIEA
jgi:hypothetical protein